VTPETARFRALRQRPLADRRSSSRCRDSSNSAANGMPGGAPGLLLCQEAGVSPCAPGRRPTQQRAATRLEALTLLPSSNSTRGCVGARGDEFEQQPVEGLGLLEAGVMRRVRDHLRPRVGRLAGDASGMSSVSRSPTMTSTAIVSADNGRGSGQAGAPSLAVSSSKGAARHGRSLGTRSRYRAPSRARCDHRTSCPPGSLAAARQPVRRTRTGIGSRCPEVGRGGHHLGRDHSVLLVSDGLSVVALDDEPPQRFHDARLRVAEVDPTRRCRPAACRDSEGG
jgi:hypothetical protein